jgi:DNA-binding response OmpR family regulator
MNRILIGEDEPKIAAFLKKGLESNGFTTAIATDAEEIIEMALSDRFDLLLLDLGLPLKDGLNVLEEIRGQGGTLSIIILTARDDLQDKVRGLEGGADDYLTKPFRFEELLARVRLRLRSHQKAVTPAEMVLRLEDLLLDLSSRQVFLGKKQIELSAKEFLLLEIFMRHRGQIMTRQQLLDHVWGYNYDPGSNIVDVYIGYLRKKLGSDLIETVRGIGYRLPVSPTSLHKV